MKYHPNPASVRDLKQDISYLQIISPPFKSTTKMSGTLNPNFSTIQRLVNRKHDLNVVGRRERLQQKNHFPYLFSLVESSLKNLSYVLISSMTISMSNWIILSRPSSIYRVMFFLTNPKPTTNRITISILFLIELKTI